MKTKTDLDTILVVSFVYAIKFKVLTKCFFKGVTFEGNGNISARNNTISDINKK